MTTLLTSRVDKARSLAILEQLLHHYLFPGLTPAERTLTNAHIDWMKAQPTAMTVSCRLGTIEQGKVTKIILDVSFAPPSGVLKN